LSKDSGCGRSDRRGFACAMAARPDPVLAATSCGFLALYSSHQSGLIKFWQQLHVAATSAKDLIKLDL